jgi:hypothetical protein
MTLGPDFPAPEVLLANSSKAGSNVLVIGGVHGTEASGVEVVRRLIGILSEQPPKKHMVIVVPILFAANYARACRLRSPAAVKGSFLIDWPDFRDSKSGRYTLVDGEPYHEPNRQFPPKGRGLSTCRRGAEYWFEKKTKDKGTQRLRIEAENIQLMQLITKLQPIRIITVHAITMPMKEVNGVLTRRPIKEGSQRDKKLLLPGVFVDPAVPAGGVAPEHGHDDELAEATARAVADSQRRARERGLVKARYGDLYDEWVVGNWLKPKSAVTRYQTEAGQMERGVSLGQWGAHEVNRGEKDERRAGISVFTVEVRRQYPASAYLDLFKGGSPSERQYNARLKAEYVERALEIDAHAEAIARVLIDEFLGAADE